MHFINRIIIMIVYDYYWAWVKVRQGYLTNIH